MQANLYPQRRIRHIITIPFIWAMVLPLLILDIGIEIYHQICFRLCDIPRVKRSNYIAMDRQRLKYLTWYDKVNCAYCGYANGVLAYSVEIGARTEAYWCGIKHQSVKGFVEPVHHKDFTPFGNEKAFNEKYCKLDTRARAKNTAKDSSRKSQKR